ncbi:acyl-CoA synthetase (AMP-forming)/AMP-acid ligase II [Bradyrhizobium sp. AZCC 1678]|uniref:class I adenylate-forming enzyme family protein n=1 Tax=Bradyrhizobium sp. AZCC 1678 TaxID=3117030 RepID=UPI002FF34BE3
MRVSDHFEKAALANPDVEFAVFGDLRVTYAEARRTAHAIATALSREPGLTAGAVIGIYSSNDPRISMLQMGINRADFAWVGVHDRNAVETNAEVLDFMDAELVFFNSRYEKEVRQLRAGNSRVRRWICIDADSPEGESLASWLDGNFEEFPYSKPDMMLRACLVPTGGTTGPSKAVVHTNYTLEQGLIAQEKAFRIQSRSRVLSIAPLSHAAGMFAMAFYPSAGTNVIMSGFDAEKALHLIEQERITHLFMPPTMIGVLLVHPKVKSTDFSSVKMCLTGAAPIAPEKFKEIVALLGPVVWESYAQSETHMPVTVKAPEDYILKDGSFDESALRSAGRAAEYVRIEIMDDDGNILPRGQRGEIVVSMPSLMQCYYKNPEATNEVSAFGFHHTGDVGIMDDAGFVTIVDRKKDMIVSGAFNIFPSEIEKIIYEIPAVQDCIVVGAPHEKWGEAVTAVIQLKPGHALNEDEVLELCRERLGGMKTPKRVEIWSELPRSPVGKLLRRVVREQFWQGHWRSI